MGTCVVCADCRAGEYRAGCGSQALTDCQCKSGFGSTNNAECIECTAGKYKGSGDECTECEAGKFSASAGTFSCTLCSTCLVGQVETVPCGTGAVTNRECDSCSHSTKPSNARWTAADDCLKWVCSDGYQPRDTPKGVHTSRCVLPPPAAGQLVSTVSIELTLRGVTPAQVYEKEEELVSAFSKLVQEDAGNIFLLSVQEARTARHTFPLHLSADVTHASPRAMPSSSMHSDALGGGGVRSDTQVTIGVRTDKPAQVQQGISLTAINTQLSGKPGKLEAIQLKFVTTFEGDLANSGNSDGAAKASNTGDQSTRTSAAVNVRACRGWGCTKVVLGVCTMALLVSV